MAALLLALSACGEKAALKPRTASAVPPAPYGRDRPATSSAMLIPSPQAVPTRSEELHIRSEQRDDDPFDLPPAGR